MGRRRRMFLAMVFFLVVPEFHAWAQEAASLPDWQFRVSSRIPTLPDGADWVIMIHETGGFAGVDRGATIDSTGTISCVGFSKACSEAIGMESLRSLDQQIRDARPDGWSGSPAPGSDLLRREVVLVLHESGAHTAYWDLAPTDSSVSAARLHQVVRDILLPD